MSRLFQGGLDLTVGAAWSSVASDDFRDLEASPSADLDGGLHYYELVVTNSHTTQSVRVVFGIADAGDTGTDAIYVGPGATRVIDMSATWNTSVSLIASGAGTVCYIQSQFRG